MCGIAGIVSRHPLDRSDQDSVRRMSDFMVHRGPDEAGLYNDLHVTLAMRRLGIIDLKGGAQPLYNEDRRIVLVANGEIYNYVELKHELETRGHHFRTGSDCETIVHLYEEYGNDCVTHLRGMFAFALWDERTGTLLLARDRMGEKPLYLYENEGKLVFASELRALVHGIDLPFALNPVAVDRYFHYGYVPDPGTILEGVGKLPAGHTLVVQTRPWRTTTYRYWRISDATPIEEEPVACVRNALDSVFRSVIRSDVPVGVALSGGIDSSAIAALGARNAGVPFHAFTVGYHDRTRNDERSHARAYAKTLGIPCHEIVLSSEEMSDCFPDTVYLRDDPIASITGFAYFAISRAVRQAGVPVLIQGHGADELFWGYPWVISALRETVADRARDNSRSPAAIFLREILRVIPLPPSRARIRAFVASGVGVRNALARLAELRGAPDNRTTCYDITPGYIAAQLNRRQRHPPAFFEVIGNQLPSDDFSRTGENEAPEILLTRLLCENYLREEGMTQGDRLSMANSVENRLPFVDHKFVETVIGLRKAHPDSHLGPKAWLKEALETTLPSEILSRPKRGFAPPTHIWLHSLSERYGHQLKDGYLVQNGILRAEAIPSLLKKRLPFDSMNIVCFRALVLETWCRQIFVRTQSHKDNVN